MRRIFEALNGTDDGAFIIDEQRQIIFWNKAAESILGYSAEEVGGFQCFEVLGGRDEEGRTLCQRYCRFAIGAARGETLPNMNVYATTRNGKGRWINVTTFAFATGVQRYGNVIVHLFRDASEAKSNEQFVRRVVKASRELGDTTELPEFDAPAAAPPGDPALTALTPRQRHVLFLMAHGLGTAQIASELSISPATVRNHIQNILETLMVHSRLEAVAYAYRRGLIDPGGN